MIVDVTVVQTVCVCVVCSFVLCTMYGKVKFVNHRENVNVKLKVLPSASSTRQDPSVLHGPMGPVNTSILINKKNTLFLDS